MFVAANEEHLEVYRARRRFLPRIHRDWGLGNRHVVDYHAGAEEAAAGHRDRTGQDRQQPGGVRRGRPHGVMVRSEAVARGGGKVGR